MKKTFKILSLAVLLTLVGCGQRKNNSSVTPESSSAANSQVSEAQQSSEAQLVDYASQLKLDMNSSRKKVTATLKQGVDGDTSHFYVDAAETGIEDGILKARYLGIDTPESTGKIEPWGKVASYFTTGKLTTEGVQIILESDDGKWNADSTGSRYLIYVWYKTPAMTEYKNLNLEIMQEGLALAKNIGGLCYADYFQGAYNQALTNKIKVFSNDPAPYYYYGEYQECTIKGLRENAADYAGVLVRFEGVVAKISNNTAYVIDYDEDTGLTYGMQVYYGYNFSGESLMHVGNKLSICGTYQLFEAGGTYQVSGLTYFAMRDKPTNLRLVSTGVEFSAVEIDGSVLNDTQAKEEYNGISKAESMLNVYVTAKNLTVTKVYTTKSGDSKGAMTLTCKDASGKEVVVRTEVIKKDSDGNLLEEADVLNKTIDVTGIIDKYTSNSETTYQIRIFGMGDIVIK